MKKIGEILKEARKKLDLSQEDVAEKVRTITRDKFSRAALSQIESGDTKNPKPQNLQAACDALGIDFRSALSGRLLFVQEAIEGEVIRSALPAPEKNEDQEFSAYFGEFDLWDGSTPLNDDEVALNLFKEVEMAGGAGRHEVIENHGLKLRFAKSTLKKRNVIEENAACAVLSGNSMEPVMPDGTTIGIDKGKTKIIDGKIYAIDHDGHFRVKMVFKLPGGGLRLSSYNKDDWPDERYSPEESRKIRIIGYVFWWSAFQD
jgi:phage repressor protein C with HTH and peptisase S24 domain/DNA-binding XRE family transcriptional regulator